MNIWSESTSRFSKEWERRDNVDINPRGAFGRNKQPHNAERVVPPHPPPNVFKYNRRSNFWKKNKFSCSTKDSDYFSGLCGNFNREKKSERVENWYLTRRTLEMTLSLRRRRCCYFAGISTACLVDLISQENQNILKFIISRMIQWYRSDQLSTNLEFIKLQCPLQIHRLPPWVC